MSPALTAPWKGRVAGRCRPRHGASRRLRGLLALLLLSVAGSALVPSVAARSTTPTDGVHRAPEETGLVVSQVLGVRDLSDAVDGRTAVWDWPLVGTPRVVQTFDPPAQRWLPGHRGIDLAGVAGERVLAVDAGVITFSGKVAGVGVVSVTHESGLRSTYQPVGDRAARGERVRRGHAVGVLDPVGSHCLLVDCLHLGAVRGREDYVDPLLLLLGVELALLPVGP